MPSISKTRRFEALVLPHLDAAYNLARWLTRDPDAAEDAVQEAFLRAFRYFDSCREAGARPWLLRIVRNTCYDWLRVERLGGIVDFDVADAGATAAFPADVFADSADDPETAALRESDRQLVNRLIAELPLPLREILILREMEDLSYREIAAVAAIPIGTVMSRLSRARQAIHKAWCAAHAGEEVRRGL